MLRSLFIWAIFLGIAGLLIALIAKSGIGPAWFTELDLTIAAISGILIGGGLGAWLDGFRNPRERLSVSVAVMALGLLYVVFAAVPPLQDKVFVQWLDIYFAAGGAISGSALSVMLAHLRR